MWQFVGVAGGGVEIVLDNMWFGDRERNKL